VGGDFSSIYLASTLLFTFPGAPCIFYGDEIGLPGDKDPDCRRGFPPEADWNLDIYKHDQTLIALRLKYPALRTGKYQILHAQDDIYSFARVLDSQTIIVALNASDETAKTSYSVSNLTDKPQSVVYGDGTVAWDGDRLEVSIAPRNFVLIA
jgi:cyclomaltodextrinase